MKSSLNQKGAVYLYDLSSTYYFAYYKAIDSSGRELGWDSRDLGSSPGLANLFAFLGFFKGCSTFLHGGSDGQGPVCLWAKSSWWS